MEEDRKNTKRMQELETCIRESAQALYEFTPYGAVHYKIAAIYLKDESLIRNEGLKEKFLNSDIVNELYEEQLPDGSFGPLRDKDYSARVKFPTTYVALNRCHYIGLQREDRDILLSAEEYLEEYVNGTNRNPLYNKNERAVPGQMAEIAEHLDRIEPYHPLCDEIWNRWLYIADRAFDDGTYSHERDKAAQQEIFFTREDRLIPMPLGLLLGRREKMTAGLEEAMLRHYGEAVYEHGFFWNVPLTKLPFSFHFDKTRRWFESIRYINRFTGSALYLKDAVEWLMENRGEDKLWNYGTQVKDPWGYFRYFSVNRNYRHNKIVDCSMEILDILNEYRLRNGSTQKERINNAGSIYR